MSISQTVGQHVPYLRRYARALSGSQASGDAYVAATLEALIQDPEILDSDASTRVALYRLFSKIWNSVALNGRPAADVAAPNQAVERHIAQIAPKPRQAFLLVALEGLSEDDAAKVLDVDVPTLRQLVEDAGRELAEEIATDVLIIEDEPFIALDLKAWWKASGIACWASRAPTRRPWTWLRPSGRASSSPTSNSPTAHRGWTRSTRCCARSKCR